MKYQSMYEHYFNRTFKHIQLVRNNILFLITNKKNDLELSKKGCQLLSVNAMKHDASKFNDVQFEPYVDFSWKMKKTKNYKESTSPGFEAAWKNHYTIENHHFQSGKYLEKIELIEVACDLFAMSQELKNSAMEYFKNTWCKSHNDFFINKKSKENKQSYDDYDYCKMVETIQYTITLLEKQHNPF